MGTTTTTFALNKPTVGGDDNAWGGDWNSNADKLDDLLDGTTGITPNLLTGWEVGGTAVTATAAELNVLDGVTATTAELNVLDGVTATTAELNVLDGVTATTAELNVLDGVTATTAELNVLDGIAGIASQAEAEAGTDNTKLMTPLRTQQALDGLSLNSVTLLGTINTTSGSSVTLSGLTLTGYKQLSVVFNAVSGSSAATIYVTLNGYNLFRTTISDAATVAWGGGTIDLTSGIFWSSSLISGTTNGLVLAGESGLTTASTSITFTISAGNFDAGSILVYGVK